MQPVALVTGGARRIGRAISLALASAGYRVWIHHHTSTAAAADLARTLANLPATSAAAAEDLGPDSPSLAISPGSGACLGTPRADLADPAARADLVRTILDPAGPAGGRLDLLVNNASSFERGPLADRTDADLRRVLEVNLVAPLALARTLAPALAAAAGSIVNILDIAAYQPWRGHLDHCTAKAGLAMATRGLALELAPAVRVNGVAPGMIAWPEDDDRYGPGAPARERILRAIPLQRIGSPDDIARTVVFLAHSGFITGQTIAVDGGRTAAAAPEVH